MAFANHTARHPPSSHLCSDDCARPVDREDAVVGKSRENLEKASLRAAVLAVIKPAAGIDLPLRSQ